MKKTFYLFAAAILICSFSYAKIFRVGYNGIALTGVDFATVDLAENAATAGDTIQIYGTPSGGTTINKRLVILGFGYNFDVHPGLQAIGTNSPSSLSNLTFATGSDGSIVSGVSGDFTVGSTGTATLTNITFQRCYGNFRFANQATNNRITNIRILSSVITSGSMQANGANDFPVTNLEVFNCYIIGFTLYKVGTTAVFINCVSPAPGQIFGTPITFNDAGVLVRNCILSDPNFNNGINTVFENNFFTTNQPGVLPPGSNNRWGQTFASLFNRLNASSDNPSSHSQNVFDENYFILKAGSPAINGGIDGNGNPTDCGIFGGEPAFVYKPSGVPAVPAIYKLTAPTLNANSNPYNVTISVKSNN